MHTLKRLLLVFLADAVVPVTITTPACGSTLTNAAVSVAWSFSPGTQYSYRLRVYADAALTIVVYDTGTQVDATLATNIPFGILSTGTTYYAVVNVLLTDGTEGVSSACSWVTSFATSVNVTGVTLTGIGACVGDSTELPGILVRWSQVTPAVTETFVEYDVKRRIYGETAWERVAIIVSVSTLRWTDYQTMPGTVYEYSVTWTAYSGPSTLTSADQSPPKALMPEFDFLFVHDVLAPTYYVRLDTWQVDESIEQQVEYMQLAGRLAAVAQIGEKQLKHWRVPALERPLAEPTGNMWADLEELIARQRTEGSILCARFGVARSGMFCQASIQRSITRRTHEVTVDMTEVDYVEAV